MTSTILKKIEQNPNLIKFCNRILNYNAIFENETSRYMFLVSLISADSLTDVEACDETIEIARFILDHIDLLILEDAVKKELIEKLTKAIRIANRDKKECMSKTIDNVI